LALSDYAYVIAEGRIFTEGEPAALAAKPEIRRLFGTVAEGWPA